MSLKKPGSKKSQKTVTIPEFPTSDVSDISTSDVDDYNDDLSSKTTEQIQTVHIVNSEGRAHIINQDGLSEPKVSRGDAAKTIERAWLRYRDIQIFRLLKHALCAAERSLSYEILRKVSPREAELLKDKSLKCKVRFRFGGLEFPPLIFFKVYISTAQGPKVNYVHGRKMLQASTQGARDACDQMGNRKYYENLLKDTMHYEHYKITDEMDVTTLKDYMQYLSHMDELPAYMGGRENYWRKLTQEDLPRHLMFYDILDFIYNRKMSDELREQVPSLIQRPTTQAMQVEHMRIVSAVRTPRTIQYSASTRARQNILTTPPTSTRRSRKAKDRVMKMKQMYEANKEMESGELSKEKTNDAMVIIDPMDQLNKDLQEAEQLYTWTQQLSMDEIFTPTARTPNTRTQLSFT